MRFRAWLRFLRLIGFQRRKALTGGYSLEYALRMHDQP